MPEKPNLFILIPIGLKLRAPFEERFNVRHIDDLSERPALLAKAGGEADAVLTNTLTGLTRAEFEALPKVKIVCVRGVGVDKVDLEVARERGISVTNGAGATAPCVADHAIALLASAVRDLPGYGKAVRDGRWVESRGERPQLSGKRIGIVGLGRIGRIIATRALGFEMTIGYHNRKPRTDVDFRYFDSPLALAEWADFVILSCPGGMETRNMVDAKFLAALGKDGFLVNIARGSVVDNAALVDALRDEKIAGAALDVIEDPAKIPEEILRSPRVVLTPHVASFAPEGRQATLDLALANLVAHFAKQPLLTPV